MQYIKKIANCISKERSVVFLPDYKSPSTLFGKNITTIYEPQYDIRLKSAMIEISKCSIFQNGGGSPLAFLNKKATYIAHGLCEGLIFNRSWFESQGITPDTNPLKENANHQVWKSNLATQTELTRFINKFDLDN